MAERRMNNTAVGVLAHVDAGKTTLSEQILYRCGALREAGRVDEQSAYLDYSEVERRRGITVFSDQAELSIAGRPFTLVDTPGHADFSGEMERALSVLDCAVLVVSAVEGVQAHTETLWRLLRDRKIPTFVFLNKTDRAGADPKKVLGQLRRLGAGFCSLDNGLSAEGEFSPAAAEALAELDDELLEAYFSGSRERNFWLEKAGELAAARKLFPVFSGSALKGQGIEGLLTGLRLLAPEPKGSEEGAFGGLVYKVRHDKGGRVVYLKVEQGILRPKDSIEVLGAREKCNEVRSYSGAKYELLREAGPGTLCAVTGVQSARPGDRVGAGSKQPAINLSRIKREKDE